MILRWLGLAPKTCVVLEELGNGRDRLPEMKVTLLPSGKVVRVGRRNDPHRGRRSAKVSAHRVQAILDQLDAMGFFDVNADPAPTHRGSPTARLSYTRDGRTHAVRIGSFFVGPGASPDASLDALGRVHAEICDLVRAAFPGVG